MENRSTPSRSADLAAGFLGGFLALVAGFAVTVLAVSTDENRERVEEVFSSEGPGGVSLSQLLPEWYQLTGWVFLESHQVTVSVRVGETFGTGQWVGEYAETLLPTAPELQVVPPLLLAGAGALVALRQPRPRPADAVLSGASVVVGYLPGVVALAAVSTFEVTVFGGIVLAEVGPDFARAVFVAGVAYPVLFGGLGGVLAFALARS